MSESLFDLLPCCEHCVCPRGSMGHTVPCPDCERAAGQKAKEEGMALALSPDPLTEWKAAFRSTVTTWAGQGKRFTSEDVTDYIGLPSGAKGMNANNAVGAMMNALARKGIIRKTYHREPSRRPSSHGAELVVWTAPTEGEAR